jgi:hypothetical protein
MRRPGDAVPSGSLQQGESRYFLRVRVTHRDTTSPLSLPMTIKSHNSVMNTLLNTVLLLICSWYVFPELCPSNPLLQNMILQKRNA